MSDRLSLLEAPGGALLPLLPSFLRPSRPPFRPSRPPFRPSEAYRPSEEKDRVKDGKDGVKDGKKREKTGKTGGQAKREAGGRARREAGGRCIYPSCTPGYCTPSCTPLSPRTLGTPRTHASGMVYPVMTYTMLSARQEGPWAQSLRLSLGRGSLAGLSVLSLLSSDSPESSASQMS